MYIELDVRCNVSHKEYKRLLSSDDIQKGVIGSVGEKILKINIDILNNTKDINDAIKALELYKTMV